MFDRIAQASAEFFLQRNIKGVIFDIDNTLAPYEMLVPDEQVREYLRSLTNAGIKFSFVSNNDQSRVERFNVFGCFAVYNAGKPFKKELLRAMAAMNTARGDTALCGDQIFTDIFAAKRIGLFTVMVKPIKDKTTLFFKFKRLLERPFIYIYKRKHHE